MFLIVKTHTKTPTATTVTMTKHTQILTDETQSNFEALYKQVYNCHISLSLC